MANNLELAETFSSGITENNCNARLTYLYKKRDSISQSISMLIARDIDCSSAEADYDRICDIIDKLCCYRSSHNCLLEGDEGYCLY